jgi:IPT/TIG domain
MKIPSVIMAGLIVMSIGVGVGCGAGTATPSTHLFTAANIAPSISVLSPSTVPVGSPGFSMTINGSNFGSDAIAFFNGNPQRTTFISSSQIMVTLIDTDLQHAGMVPIFVRTQGLNSNTLSFDVAVQ